MQVHIERQRWGANSQPTVKTHLHFQNT